MFVSELIIELQVVRMLVLIWDLRALYGGTASLLYSTSIFSRKCYMGVWRLII